MATTRLLVIERFGTYLPGDRIAGAAEMQRVTETHPEFVLREPVTADTKPTKAEVRAAGKPPETGAREVAGLPPEPLAGRVTIND